MTSVHQPFIKWLAEVTIGDVSLVGGRDASPGSPDTLIKTTLAILETERTTAPLLP